ncbi:MAG: polysaccharide biosynthesis C-terminal domain-containing protein, partial [Chloroflexota bacterium]
SGALAGFAAGTVLSCVISIIFAYPILHQQRFPKTHFSLHQVKMAMVTILTPVIPFLIANLSGVLMVNSDLLALKLMADTTQADLMTGYYQVATVLARVPYFLGQAIMWIIFPLIARQVGRPLLANRESRFGLQLTISFILMINVVMMVIPNVVLAFFFPPAYVSVGPTLRILAAAMSFNILAQILATILQARDRAWISAWALSAAVIVQLLALSWAVPSWGMQGAAWASFTAAGLASLMMIIGAYHAFPAMLSLSFSTIVKQLIAFGVLVLILAPLPIISRIPTLLWITASIGAYVATLLVLQIFTVEWAKILPFQLPSFIHKFILRSY